MSERVNAIGSTLNGKRVINTLREGKVMDKNTTKTFVIALGGNAG